jgi:hypothetical protein
MMLRRIAVRVGWWLLDRAWPTLRKEGEAPAAPEPFVIGEPVTDDVVRLTHDKMCDALAAEDERAKGADARLIAVCTVAPVVVTVLVTLVGFLTSEKIQDFTPLSVAVVALSALYVALQFLRALLAAIEGLAARAYLAATVAGLTPQKDDSINSYLGRISSDLATRLDQHRRTTNDKISQMKLAHVAITNGVSGLIVALLLLAIIALHEAC